MKIIIIFILSLTFMTAAYSNCHEKISAINDMIGWQGQAGSAIDHLAINNDIFEDTMKISNNLGSNGGYIKTSDLRRINTVLNPVLVGNQIAQRNMEDISIKLNELIHYCK
jgi:hypothetical protein